MRWQARETQRPRRRRPAGIALALGALLACLTPAGAAGPVETQGARLGLIVGGVSDGIAHLGLTIDLKPGWHTYWRYPGDSGVPPLFSSDGSTNLAGISVDYPAPERFGDAGDQTIGYRGSVTLLVDARLGDPARPADLVLNARLGVCRDICVPVDETLSVTIDPASLPDPAAVVQLKAATSALPRAVAAGADLSVIGISRNPALKPEMATLTLKGDPAAIADVFVEGPEGWALPLPSRIAPAQGEARSGESQWTFALDGLPSGSKPQGARLTVTVVGKAGAATQTVTLP